MKRLHKNSNATPHRPRSSGGLMPLMLLVMGVLIVAAAGHRAHRAVTEPPVPAAALSASK